MNSRYIERIIRLLHEVDEKEAESIKKAGTMIADSIMAGGIMITFGSGHSLVGAKELVSRAGGLFAAKMINDPSGGIFESIEGTGKKLIEKVQILPEDVMILISNSGRNPASIEMAIRAKEVGAKLIVVTALDASKLLKSKHSSGKLLYEFADCVLDLHTDPGDASIEVEGVEGKICGTSTVSTVALLQSAVLVAVETMVERGFNPPVRISKNLDSAPGKISPEERSREIEKRYADRIYRI